MDLLAKIKGIKYKPFLCRDLEIVSIENIKNALAKKSAFILKINKNKEVAVSTWVSPKRTRSYPYARVYDTLNFTGKKITIIPVIKDEGKEGDRDFLQWDTISLMSLLDVYLITSYYKNAKRSKKYRHKITNQEFDVKHIKKELKKLLTYQSSALHWNIEKVDKVGNMAKKALKSYIEISRKLKVNMHSRDSAEKKIKQLLAGKKKFMPTSRDLAQKAQQRESLTIQPKESLSGTKGIITIKNYLGGYYYFTFDEIDIKDKNVYLVEGKHSKTNVLPSLEDIKDGLVKMILFSNLEDIKINNKIFKPIAVLKLTVENGFNPKKLTETQKKNLVLLRKEAKINNFKIIIK